MNECHGPQPDFSVLSCLTIGAGTRKLYDEPGGPLSSRLGARQGPDTVGSSRQNGQRKAKSGTPRSQGVPRPMRETTEHASFRHGSREPTARQGPMPASQVEYSCDRPACREAGTRHASRAVGQPHLGAGSGNRTRTTSLEGWGATITPYPLDKPSEYFTGYGASRQAWEAACCRVYFWTTPVCFTKAIRPFRVSLEPSNVCARTCPGAIPDKIHKATEAVLSASCCGTVIPRTPRPVSWRSCRSPA